jgi:hypothetical protein
MILRLQESADVITLHYQLPRGNRMALYRNLSSHPVSIRRFRWQHHLLVV